MRDKGMRGREDKETEGARARYRASVRVAVVAGVLSLIILALLLSNYLLFRISDPLDSKKLIELKDSLRRQPDDDSLKEQIRELDLQLRKEYFRRREFSRIGAYLLVGSASGLLIGAGIAASYRKKLPMPQRVSEEQDGRAAALARQAVAVFGAFAVGFALALVILDNGLQYQVFPGVGDQTVSETVPAEEPGIGYPSAEEIKKNWPRFRGPGGLGVSSYTNVPVSWNGETGEGILWKTPIPLPGKNSPVVWGDRIFLTGATEKERAVYCFDANSGEMLWGRAVENVPFSEPEPPEVSEDTGFAAPTATTDGQRVYAIFANGDLISFDFNGNQIWARNLGPFKNVYGYASSLNMYQNLLIILLDQGGAEDGISEIIGIEGTSGKTVWETDRPVPNSWATPIIIDTGEREEIITCGNPWVIAYEPVSGKEFWRAKCLGGDIAPSPVYGNGLVFVTNTYEILAAIRPGGEGDVTETHIVWTAEDGLPDICSPFTNGELVFLLETYGFLTCYDARDGTKVWEQDLDETFTASPSLAGDNLYFMTDDGIMIIVGAGREFKEAGRSKLGEKSEACPAFLDGRIYIRGEENLYCIAQ
jgi:outer membrane protein assembly factor BamB